MNASDKHDFMIMMKYVLPPHQAIITDDFSIRKDYFKKLVRADSMRTRCNTVVSMYWRGKERKNYFFKCPLKNPAAQKIKSTDLAAIIGK